MSRVLYQLAFDSGAFTEAPDDDETMEWAAVRIRELEQQLSTEKKRRIHYQHIVYSVCNMLDRIDGRHPGYGIVCGTAEEQYDDVEARVQQLTTELDSLRQQLTTAQERNKELEMICRSLGSRVAAAKKNGRGDILCLR